ncbi:MAG: PEP-CTERM sorting domain-containing protein [Verrucomicrobiae bacterium]|nr:PEP-CTERM sorting domain-containing protein [Verrucomicrobiae bacterium]
MVARASRLRSFGMPQKPQAGRSRHHGKASFETHSEPSSLGLIILGAGGIILKRRSRRVC